MTSVPEEPFTAASVGITNPLASLYPGAPTLSFAGGDSLFFLGSSTLADQSSRINAYTAADTLSWTMGNHRLKFGGEYRFSQVKFYFNAFTRGQIIYADTFNASGVRTVTAFQNFLLGNGTSLLGSGVFDRYFKVTDTNAFVQDDWKVNSRLTLNLGLRYDLFGLPVENQGRLVNFIPGQVRIGTFASPAAPPNGFVQADGGPLAECRPSKKLWFRPIRIISHRVSVSLSTFSAIKKWSSAADMGSTTTVSRRVTPTRSFSTIRISHSASAS